MIIKEDRTFKDLQERSVEDWLMQIENHEDLLVRGGVKATREYIANLKNQIRVLEEKGALKDQYLKKMKKNRPLPEIRNI